MSSTRLRLLIVDDHFLIRTGLAGTLNAEPDLLVVAEAANGRQAIEQHRLHRPDVSLIDLRLPKTSGAEAIAAIRVDAPQAKILAFSTYDADEEIYRAMEAGARGYLPKAATREELLQAVRAVGAGRFHMPADIAGRLATRIPRSELSLRELEVLRLVVKGASNKQIASALGISEATVKIHASHIFAKLGVNDRTEAAMAAVQRGIVSLDP